MFLLIWPFRQCLKHSSAFLTQSNKVQIPQNKDMIRPITISKFLLLTSVLGSFIAMKRYHDHDNSYKKLFSWRGSLRFQTFSPLSSWQGASYMQADVVLDLRMQHLAGNRKLTDLLRKWPEHEKSQHLPPQWYTFSNKTIPTLTRPYLLIVPFPMRLWGIITFKLLHPASRFSVSHVSSACSYYCAMITCYDYSSN